MFWKIKGITAKTTYRLFMKYGDPSTVSRKDDNAELTKQFANNVALKYSIPLLESHVTLLL